MAEINIERKKTPVWRWILILLLLALVAWAVYEFALKPADDDIEEVPATGMVSMINLQPLLVYNRKYH